MYICIISTARFVPGFPASLISRQVAKLKYLSSYLSTNDMPGLVNLHNFTRKFYCL